MRAIFKHELKAYFNSPLAYAVVGIFVLISSIYYYIGNLKGHSADLSPLFDTMGITLLFILPIVTSRTIAEDRKSGIEVLTITSPASIAGIVLGKFFAVLGIFFVMSAFTLLYPLLIALFANLSLLSLTGNYIGFILLGAGIIAFGVFVSSLTENQVVAAILSFAGLLIMFIIQPIAVVLGGNAAKVLNWFSIFSRYDEFGRGVFSVQTVLYYISFAFVFLFATVQVLEFRRQSKG